MKKGRKKQFEYKYLVGTSYYFNAEAKAVEKALQLSQESMLPISVTTTSTKVARYLMANPAPQAVPQYAWLDMHQAQNIAATIKGQGNQATKLLRDAVYAYGSNCNLINAMDDAEEYLGELADLLGFAAQGAPSDMAGECVELFWHEIAPCSPIRGKRGLRDDGAEQLQRSGAFRSRKGFGDYLEHRNAEGWATEITKYDEARNKEACYTTLDKLKYGLLSGVPEKPGAKCAQHDKAAAEVTVPRPGDWIRITSSDSAAGGREAVGREFVVTDADFDGEWLFSTPSFAWVEMNECEFVRRATTKEYEDAIEEEARNAAGEEE